MFILFIFFHLLPSVFAYGNYTDAWWCTKAFLGAHNTYSYIPSSVSTGTPATLLTASTIRIKAVVATNFADFSEGI